MNFGLKSNCYCRTTRPPCSNCENACPRCEGDGLDPSAKPKPPIIAGFTLRPTDQDYDVDDLCNVCAGQGYVHPSDRPVGEAP